MKRIKDWINDEAPFIEWQILVFVSLFISGKLFLYLGIFSNILCLYLDININDGTLPLVYASTVLFACVFSYGFMSWSEYYNLDYLVQLRRINRLNNCGEENRVK